MLEGLLLVCVEVAIIPVRTLNSLVFCKQTSSLETLLLLTERLKKQERLEELLFSTESKAQGKDSGVGLGVSLQWQLERLLTRFRGTRKWLALYSR